MKNIIPNEFKILLVALLPSIIEYELELNINCYNDYLMCIELCDYHTRNFLYVYYGGFQIKTKINRSEEIYQYLIKEKFYKTDGYDTYIFKIDLLDLI